MSKKWKVYFGTVALVALLMFMYDTNVWAKLGYITSPEQASQHVTTIDDRTSVEKEEKSNQTNRPDQYSLTKEMKKADKGITPVKLSIPKISVEAEVNAVGILDNGQMGVPEQTEDIGWFEPGVKPGQTGNAVVAGHVDSIEGPAVFFDLEKLARGDELTIEGKDGQTLTYVVKRLQRYVTAEAPIEEIFGETEKKRLNLITCTGTFNHDLGSHEERLVVYTELLESE
ncbi:hypothetical protein N781_07720 [Pontibacillus halophilus JSM 076056 = DSM 19796]|uniref:Peptidase C60 n=1 Tax=Pontibacillus halophilus JSM 076056 = DSM 19796 TaxID=1385510 RepID=A0A0A5I1A1_9BACI|nr:class F sortase [Pontibacillus halophilus]KGX89642.1 hypothetical protein N781_07720 [Pontibacillus halophilus JSM 076056 = DSM 19796]